PPSWSTPISSSGRSERIDAVSARSCGDDSKLRAKRIAPPTRGSESRLRSASVSAGASTPSMIGPRTLVTLALLRGLPHQRLHLAYGFAQADEHAARNDRVTDVQLAHTRQRGDRLHVDVIQRVTRVEAHAEIADRASRDMDAIEL